MQVGLLHEGRNDEKALTNLISRIICVKRTDLSPETVHFLCKEAHGNIQGHIPQTIHLFFKLNSCDIAVFASDLDPGSLQAKAKQQRITRITKQNLIKIHPTGIVVNAFPKPELEAWLLYDEQAVKSVLNISGTLPFEDCDPKSRLTKIIHAYPQFSFSTDSEIYGEIANRVDITALLSNSSFKRFYNKILSVV